MRFVVAHEAVVEVRWMWLPTFIGQNLELMRKLERELTTQFIGMKATEETLDMIHEWVVDRICKEYPLIGIRDYLHAIEKVQLD
jgi:hypothetical protein